MTSFFFFVPVQDKTSRKYESFKKSNFLSLVRCLCQHFVFAGASSVTERQKPSRRNKWNSLSFNEIICKRWGGRKFKWTQITPSIVSCKLDPNALVCWRFSTPAPEQKCLHHHYHSSISLLILRYHCSSWDKRWQIIKIIIKHRRRLSSLQQKQVEEKSCARIWLQR